MSNAATSSSSGPRILVVRLGAMGDVIHALPAVASLKHSFPGSHLTWLIEARWAPLLEQNPYVDRVAIFERGNPRAWMRNWRQAARPAFRFRRGFPRPGQVRAGDLHGTARPYFRLPSIAGPRARRRAVLFE